MTAVFFALNMYNMLFYKTDKHLFIRCGFYIIFICEGLFLQKIQYSIHIFRPV